MLAGRKPFTCKEGEDAILFSKHLTERPPLLREFVPEVPEALEQLVDDALKKEPSERPQSAHDFARALRAFTRADGAPTQNAEPSGLAYTTRRVPTDASHVDEGIIPSTFAEERDAGQGGRGGPHPATLAVAAAGLPSANTDKMDSQISPTGLHAGQETDAGEVKDNRVAWLAVLTTAAVVTLIAAAFLLIRPLGGPPRLPGQGAKAAQAAVACAVGSECVVAKDSYLHAAPGWLEGQRQETESVGIATRG
jgi:hypothetical protein